MTFSEGNLPADSDILQITTDYATEQARRHGAAPAIAYILSQASAIFETDQADFVNAVMYQTGKAYAWDPETPESAFTDIFDAMPRSWTLANDIADIGKEMGKQKHYVTRSHRLLRYAASMFDATYEDRCRGQPLETQSKHLLHDFFRIADLQDEVGDQIGAGMTSIIVAPRLLDMVGNLDPEDEVMAIDMNDTLGAAVVYIGSLEHPLAKQLFQAITDGGIQGETLEMLARDKLGGLILEGEITTAFELIKAEDLRPSLETWQSALRLLETDQIAVVQKLISAIEQDFPEYFINCDTTETQMGPIARILELTGRDDLLVDTFRAHLASCTDLIPLERFAYNCGTQADVRRLQSVMRQCQLQPTQPAAIFKAFELGSEAAQQN